MKASETHLGKILEGTNQFVMPLFQRPYTWDESRWKQGEIYRTLKERTDEQNPEGIATFLDELHRSALHYHRLLDPAQDLNPDLQENLGETWRETHEIRLHTLGNLTLTGYNAELSNGDFPAKRAFFLQSPIYLSRSITRFEKWDSEAIQQRGEELAELALQVWPYFGPVDSLFPTTAKAGFSGRTPVAVAVLGAKHETGTWREVLQSTLEGVRDAAPDAFDAVIAEFPRLLSSDAGKFRAPRPLGATLYFETNLSAEAIARYCQQVITASGYPASEWSVETR